MNAITPNTGTFTVAYDQPLPEGVTVRAVGGTLYTGQSKWGTGFGVSGRTDLTGAKTGSDLGFDPVTGKSEALIIDFGHNVVEAKVTLDGFTNNAAEGNERGVYEMLDAEGNVIGEPVTFTAQQVADAGGVLVIASEEGFASLRLSATSYAEDVYELESTTATSGGREFAVDSSDFYVKSVAVSYDDTVTPPPVVEPTATTDEDVAVTIDVLAGLPTTEAPAPTPTTGTGVVSFDQALPEGVTVTATGGTAFKGTTSWGAGFGVDGRTNASQGTTVELGYNPVTKTSQGLTFDFGGKTVTHAEVTFSAFAAAGNEGNERGVYQLLDAQGNAVGGPVTFSASQVDAAGGKLVIDSTGFAAIRFTATSYATANHWAETTTQSLNGVNYAYDSSDYLIKGISYDYTSGSTGEPAKPVVTATDGANGTVKVNDDGTLTYTPKADWHGEDKFTATVKNADGTVTERVVTVTVDPVNDAPVAKADAASTAYSKPVVLNVLANDTDVDGDTLTVKSLGTAANGTVVKNADGTVTYTPKAGFSGTDSFTYVTTDGNGGEATAKATITVAEDPTLPKPIATNDSATTTKGQSVTINVLANDTAANGSTGGGTSGSGSISWDQALPAGVTVTASGGTLFKGATSWGSGFGVEGRTNGSQMATQEMGYNPITKASEGIKVAFGKTVTEASVEFSAFSSGEGERGTYQLLDAAGKAIGSAVTFSAADVAANGGKLVIKSSGFAAIEFKAAPYANDPAGLQTKTMSVNGTTYATDSSDYFVKSIAYTYSAGTASGLKVVDVTNGANGTAKVNGDGTVDYIPSDGYVGKDTFTYTIQDANGQKATGTVSVDVSDINNPVVLVADSATVAKGQTSVKIDVLGNDDIPDGGPVVAIATGAANGTAKVNADGTVTYTKNAGFSGSDSFIYKVTDSNGSTGTAKVTLTVEADATTPDYGDNVVYLKPGDNLQSIVNAHPEGTTFVLKAGVYREAQIKPKSFQTFIGEDGAVMDGSVDIKGWTYSNGFWVADGFPPPGYNHGEGRDGMARYKEDLVVNDQPYIRVASMGEVGAGEFYYNGGKVYIKDNPTGKATVAMKTTSAFDGGTTQGVTLENITMKYYASMAQHGAVEGHTTKNWTLIDIDAIKNHGAGVMAGDGMKIIGGNFSNNGQLGIHAHDTTGLYIDGIVAKGNNYAGFEHWWEAGGVKILTSDNVTVKNSQFLENHGTGLWFDWDNNKVVIENNFSSKNEGMGLQYEASREALIKNNVITYNNQDGYKVGYWGSDMIIQNSSKVEAVGNHVVSDIGQGIGMVYDVRGGGSFGPHYTLDNNVHGNTIVMLSAGQNGFAASGDTDLMYAGSNKWDGNTYIAKSPQDLQFTWNGKWFTADWLSSNPIEKTGKFTYVSNPESYVKSGLMTPVAAAASFDGMELMMADDAVADGSTDIGVLGLSAETVDDMTVTHTDDGSLF